MKKKYKKIIKTLKKNSLLNFNFVMIYVIHKMLTLLKNQKNFLKYNIFEGFFKKCNRLLFIYFFN